MLPVCQQMVSKDICTQMWSRAAYLKLKVYTAQRLDHLIITLLWCNRTLQEGTTFGVLCICPTPQNIATHHQELTDALMQLLCCSSNNYRLLVCKGQSKHKVLCICMCNFILIVSYLHIDYSSVFIFMEKTAKALLQFYIFELRGSSYVCH